MGAWLGGGRAGPFRGIHVSVSAGLCLASPRPGPWRPLAPFCPLPSPARTGAGHLEPGLEPHLPAGTTGLHVLGFGGPGWEAASSRDLRCHPRPCPGTSPSPRLPPPHCQTLPPAVERKPLKTIPFSVRGGRRVAAAAFHAEPDDLRRLLTSQSLSHPPGWFGVVMGVSPRGGPSELCHNAGSPGNRGRAGRGQRLRACWGAAGGPTDMGGGRRGSTGHGPRGQC